MQGGNFVHQGVVHRKAAGGIENHDAVAFGLGLGNGALGNLDGVFLSFHGVNGYADLLAEYLELIDGGRSEGVAGAQQHLHAFLALQLQGQFAREGGLTRTVETADEDDGGIPFERELAAVSAHQFRQFIADDLDNHLLGLDGREHVAADGFLLYVFTELLGNLVTDVRVQQGSPDFLEGFGDVDFGYFSFALENFETSLELLT